MIVLLSVLLLGQECLWWDEGPNTDSIVVECDFGAGYYACGNTPTSVDSGPFGVSRVHYFPLLKLETSPEPLPGQTFFVRVRGVNSAGEGDPTAPIEVSWPTELGP